MLVLYENGGGLLDLVDHVLQIFAVGPLGLQQFQGDKNLLPVPFDQLGVIPTSHVTPPVPLDAQCRLVLLSCGLVMLPAFH